MESPEPEDLPTPGEPEDSTGEGIGAPRCCAGLGGPRKLGCRPSWVKLVELAMRMTLITGGASSGKSTRALRLASAWGPKILFVATCVPRDDEMRAKVAAHQTQRPATWQTVETTRRLSETFRDGFDGAVVDCLTLLVSQLLVEQTPDTEVYQEIRNLCEAARRARYPVAVVTNEVGCGVVPEHPLGRRFRELAGRCNQLAASLADEVELVISGIPLKVKHAG